MQARLPRGAGILLPIGSLPSRFGIGSLGREAVAFVDFLCEAGQTYWQVLPVGPTGYGDSPYQSFSAFAGNPYFIDLPTLGEQGLLTAAELRDSELTAARIPYGTIYRTRFSVLKTAARRFDGDAAFDAFCRDEAAWLDDYARFMALKERHGAVEWTRWDAPCRTRSAVGDASDEDVRFWKVCQYWFFTQWQALRAYANGRGVRLVGDIPLYVSLDSADVWARPDLFELDEDGQPTAVAGVPPDYFSAEGQRWGNPLYRYDRMAADGFAWWQARMRACARLYDVVRIDHFIGFARYFAIPAACPSARDGVWRQGPDAALTDALDAVRGGTLIIAEDLGVGHPSVRELLKKTGYPGMKVLQFAFDGNADNEYLPHNYSPNCVVYGGTHDNGMVASFCRRTDGEGRRFLLDYLGVGRVEDAPQALLRAAYASVADVAIFQLQDILGLSDEARMNTPSTVGGNWAWRLPTGTLTADTARRLRRLAELYGRWKSPREA